MKKIIQIITAALALAQGLQAASFVVSPGQSIQSAINNSTAGDNITIQTGNYNENLTITKGLDIRGAGGAVLVTGNLTITNVTLPVYIEPVRKVLDLAGGDFSHPTIFSHQHGKAHFFLIWAFFGSQNPIFGRGLS